MLDLHRRSWTAPHRISSLQRPPASLGARRSPGCRVGGVDHVVALWFERYGKLDDWATRRLPLQPIYFLAPQG
jgi:hypothetical protein